MKKKIDPMAKRLQKLRAAIRNVWQYDPGRKAVIDLSMVAVDERNEPHFRCPICKQLLPKDMATVDHEPELGSFTMETIGDWINRCFFGPQRTVCKPCHRKKPKPSRRKHVQHDLPVVQKPSTKA